MGALLLYFVWTLEIIVVTSGIEVEICETEVEVVTYSPN